MTNDTGMTSANTTSDNNKGGGPRFLIIGAGMSGILSAIKLKEAGLNNFSCYEKAERLGGTWRENTYAGIGCDVPSHFYSYSFALNPEWTHRYSGGAEIQAYFEDVAKRFGVDSQIQYNKNVSRCFYEDGRWHLEMSDGSTDTGDFVIAATGVLHQPATPKFNGMEQFTGQAFHSAQWNHDIELAGKRVGIIGTGSTAVQIFGALIDKVPELTLFQRTAQWIVPIENPAYSEEEKAEFRRNNAAIEAIRKETSDIFCDGFANHLNDADSPMMLAIQEGCEGFLEGSIQDAELREKLRPDYRAGCKRMVMSDNFYDAIQKPNANLVTDSIDQFEASGIRAKDGTLHELDVIIYATGFQVDQFMRPMEVIGRNATALNDVWGLTPSAYMAISVPQFPNFFMLNGPNGPVGNFSLIEVAELQFDYIMQLVEHVLSGTCSEICASSDAMQQFDVDRREAAKSTIWASGCNSWYIDATGLPMAWPWTYDRFREEMHEPRFEDYEII